MADTVDLEPLAGAWLARTDARRKRLQELLIIAQDTECDTCYEMAGRLRDELKALDAERAAMTAVLRLVAIHAEACGSSP